MFLETHCTADNPIAIYTLFLFQNRMNALNEFLPIDHPFQNLLLLETILGLCIRFGWIKRKDAIAADAPPASFQPWERVRANAWQKQQQQKPCCICMILPSFNVPIAIGCVLCGVTLDPTESEEDPAFGQPFFCSMLDIQ